MQHHNEDPENDFKDEISEVNRIMTTINEQTSQTFTAEFYDENNTPITPEIAMYSVHDVGSGTAIIPKTQIVNLSPSVEIETSTDDNRILTDSNTKETRNLTVQWKYRNSKGELTKGDTIEMYWDIINLKYIN